MSLRVHRLRKTEVLGVFVFLVLTLPNFSGLLGEASRGDMFLFAIVLVAIGPSLYFFRAKVPRRPLSVMAAFFVVFIGLILLSLARDLDRVVIGDFFEFHRPIYGFLVTVFFYALLKDGEVHKISKFFYLSGVVISFVAIAQIAFPSGVHEVTGLLFGSAKDILRGKATGTFHTTYFFASVGTFFIFFYLLRAVNRGSVIDGVFSLLFILLVLFSQSRSGLLGLGAAIFVFILVFLKMTRRRLPRRMFFVSLSILVLFGIYIFNNFYYELSYLSGGVAKLFKFDFLTDSTGSFGIRFSQIVFAVSHEADLPILGRGVGKGYARLLESVPALYIYRYGLLGFAVFLYIYVWYLFRTFSVYRMMESHGVKGAEIFGAGFFWLISYSIGMFSSAMHDHTRVAILFYGIIGMLFAMKKNISSQRL